jgi:aspartate carbamoyltransferase regulatory subunit
LYSYGQSADDAALRSLAKDFFAAYESRNVDRIMMLWSEKSPDSASSKQVFQQIFSINKIELKSLTVHGITATNDNATVRLVADISVVDEKTGKPAEGSGGVNRTLHCVKEGDQWKIWKYVKSESGVHPVRETRS